MENSIRASGKRILKRSHQDPISGPREIRAVFTSVWKRVTAMVEPAASVGGGDAVEGRRESGFGGFEWARLGGAEGTLRLGPAGFDRREIGRIARQVEELDPGFGKGDLDSLRLVRGQVVHEHGGVRVTAPQFGDQHGS